MLPRATRAAAAILLPALIMALALAGCGQADVQPLLFGPAPWQPGEMSLYQITDRNGNPAGTVQVDLAQTKLMPADEAGWRLARETLAQGVQETLVITLSDAGFRPASSSLLRTEDERTQRLDAIYADGQVDLEMTNAQDITTNQRVSIPSDSRDARALFMLARALPLEAGYSTRLNAFLPVTARQSRVTLTAHKPQQVTVPAGAFEAWRVTLEAPGEPQSELWIGVESPHPLVKYVDGSNQGTFELAEFRPGP